MWTVIDFLKRFLLDLYHAIVFAVIEYDDKLKMTKTTSQRITIWLVVALFTGIILYGLLWGIWYFIDTLDTSRIEI